jgi:hypothetical protein
MDMPPRLARNIDEVAENIRDFARELHGSSDLQDRLSYARSWYVLPDGEKGRCFAPSKWAGYSGMTARSYVQHAATGMDGRKTESRLRKWSIPVDTKSKEYDELYNELAAFLMQYGKQPSSETRISIIENATDVSDDDDDLVELIIRVGKKLNHANRARISDALRL